MATSPLLQPGMQYTPEGVLASKLNAQKQANTVTATQNDFDRGQQKLGATQNLEEFGNFFDRFFPSADGSSASASSSGSSVGAGGPITQVPGMGTVGTWTPTVTPAPAPLSNPGSTSGPAFARAKDQVGGSLQGLMKAMGDQFSTRGIGGSSVAANAVGNTLLGGEQQLGEVARDHAMTDTNTANDWAKTNYEGALTARGQDESNAASARSAGVAMRGQDLNEADAQRSSALASRSSRMAAVTGLWSAFNKGTSSGVLY